MASVNSDFVDVQLSAAGAAIADGTLRITAHRMSYEFKPGIPVRVLTSEWAKVLSSETLQGKSIFELVPAAKAAAAPTSKAADAQAQLKTLQAEEAALETEIAQEGK